MENENKDYCDMCMDAVVCDDLNKDNDYSACSVGSSCIGYRMMLCSGGGSFPYLEVKRWNAALEQNMSVAIYYPNYCPNCGRKINKSMYGGK